MPIYIQLLTLTPEGRSRMLDDPEMLLHVEAAIDIPGVQVLGKYGVLGNYDFVNIVEATDNETVARFSLELGVRTGVHIATLPAIPIGRFEAALRSPSPMPEDAGRGLRPPTPREGAS